MSSVEIRMNEEIYESIMYWADLRLSKTCTHVVAGTTTGDKFWSKKSDNDYDNEECVSTDDGFFYYMKPLLLFPAEGYHFFWYKCRPIFFVREERKQSLSPVPFEKCYLKCFRWNKDILEDILHEARLKHAEHEKDKLVVNHCTGNIRTLWARTTQTPPDLESIITECKEPFIRDLKRYLDPINRKWYAEHGVPYRRGYLFYGPPGTGKSSLCAAAAGAFRLKIFILNLNSMTDDILNEAFASLPKRCIVLLDDVPDFTEIEDLSGDSHKNSTKQTLSHSSLLNALDGVGAAEGRVVIMTTNNLDKLSPAMIRPGRIDMRLEFDYPGRDSIKGLFRKIYSDTYPDLEDSFAAAVADKELSAADIQGYLLKYIDKPADAVEGVGAWLRGPPLCHVDSQ